MRVLAGVALAIGVLLPSTGVRQPNQPALIVAAAVSLTDALTAQAEAFAKSGDRVQFTFGASNTLARQIVNGAPVDAFISADEAQMDVVQKAGLIAEDSRVDLLANQLAIVVADDRPRTFSSIRDLLDPSLKRIAIGDPDAVPAGVYAKQYLERTGIWPQIAKRMVPTVSVRAALAAAESGTADAAIVYTTDARITRRVSVAWVVPAAEGPRIVYPAARIRDGRAADVAARFLAFLQSDGASRIFERFGFTRAPRGH
jgi:molybdate transport system substrate-binding protein